MLQPTRLMAQGGPPNAGANGKGAAQPFPDKLEQQAMRPGFPVDLPLQADGSAPEHNRNEAGAIDGPLMWRTADRKTPSSMVADYKQMAFAWRRAAWQNCAARCTSAICRSCPR